MSENPRYVPAAGIDALTGVYDVGVRLTMREGRWRRLIVDEIATTDPRVVLDVGCGTGTLTIAAADELREARVVGLDGDRKVLDLARRKGARSGSSGWRAWPTSSRSATARSMPS